VDAPVISECAAARDQVSNSTTRASGLFVMICRYSSVPYV